MKKILIVFGTRPEAIKMAPVIMELQKYPEQLQTLVCVTAQHREMLDQVLKLFKIIPDYDLNLMKKGQDLYDITSRVLIGLREVLLKEKPDLVLVHGDTTTSTSAALAAFYQKVKVGHIEAGLRTHNIYSPWPEELNRQLTSRIATYHFAPTSESRINLINESINKDSIIVTGNTIVDALHIVLDNIKSNKNVEKEILKSLSETGILEDQIFKWISKQRKLVLITGHRRENFGEGFTNICNAIKRIAINFPEVDLLYPMHLNPNVRKPIEEVFKGQTLKNVFFIEPLDYLPFVYIMSKCHLILTDSGGIQEEAPGIGKPVLVMRNTTERPEGLKAGTVKLVGTNEEKIVKEVTKLLTSDLLYEKMSLATNPYGDGLAASRIVSYLKN